MAHHKVVKLNEENLRLGPLASRPMMLGAVLAVAGLGVGAGVGLSGDAIMQRHFWHAYLTGYVYVLSITLGAMFFVLVQHLTRAGWSVAVRRVAEAMMGNVWLCAILFLPLIIPALNDKGLLWPWTQAGHLHGTKAAYLSSTWFLVRFAIYFLVWILLATYLKGASVRQDASGDVALTRRMERASYPGILLFGVTASLAAIDLMMSLNPHWYSTIFGVYFFAGSVLAFLALFTLLLLWLRGKGLLSDVVTREHYHDIGKLTFAFTFFWGYISFSQYMLIWYANLPEETQFFLPRQIGKWLVVSFILIFGHIAIPFLGLVSRHAKRRLAIFAFWAVWQLIAHFIDLFWVVMPQAWVNQIPAWNPHAPTGADHGHSEFGIMNVLGSRHGIYGLGQEFLRYRPTVDYAFTPQGLAVSIGLVVGMLGLFLVVTTLMLRGQALVPVKDPRLNESLGFENA